MQKNYFLERIIDYIEEHITEKITLKTLALEFHVSQVYLKKMFQAVFQMPISTYIRKRKLSLSTKELLIKDYRIIDIALHYGFNHVQTYINAFKQEFKVTPYQWKLSKTHLPYTEKLSFEFMLEVQNGLIVMPEFVMMPLLCLDGIVHHLGFEESRTKAPEAALSFWHNQRHQIKHVVEEGVYYGVTLHYDGEKKESDYFCAVHVDQHNRGFKKECIKPSQYIRFVYVGQHSYEKLSAECAREMYIAIDHFFKNEFSKKYNYQENIYFERIDTNLCNDHFCVMEWYIPYN